MAVQQTGLSSDALSLLDRIVMMPAAASHAPAPHAASRRPHPAGLYGGFKSIARRVQSRYALNGSHRFTDRSRHASTVVLVLAGYKQPLWPYVFPRLGTAIPEDADVCVLSAGRFDPVLDDLCADKGWSYLATTTNDVCLIQNIAIRLHRDAEMIVKVDEDMFVTTDTIRDCLSYYKDVAASGIVNPGFVAPMININGVCYRPLLSALGLLDEFEALFGVARVATLGLPLTDDARAAQWLWSKTAPLDLTVAKLRMSREPMLMAPVQFSIGLIVIAREFWESISFLPVRWHRLWSGRSTLGADEEHLCRMAMFHARPLVVCQHALAGHFSFGRQYAGMLDFLADHPEYF